jgi:hypothetical protein
MLVLDQSPPRREHRAAAANDPVEVFVALPTRCPSNLPSTRAEHDNRDPAALILGFILVARRPCSLRAPRGFGARIIGSREQGRGH